MRGEPNVYLKAGPDGSRQSVLQNSNSFISLPLNSRANTRDEGDLGRFGNQAGREPTAKFGFGHCRSKFPRTFALRYLSCIAVRVFTDLCRLRVNPPIHPKPPQEPTVKAQYK